MNIKIELLLTEVQTVLNALAKLPLEQSAEPFFKIKSQAESQLSEQKNADVSVGGTD